jgi:putative transposase
LHLHNLLKKRKYRMLFSRPGGRRPGPKGPHQGLIDAAVAMKRRNPRWGCPRIAQQNALAFGVEIDKDVVRRILNVHYRPESGSAGPSWLTFIGHAKDSLWSCDLFRCESTMLKSYWVLVVMDQFTRRIIGFGVQRGIVDGVALCRMFQSAIRGYGLPKYLSSDHDPLYRFHQWQANLRVLEVTEIKTVPYEPLSHPFIERLIGTIRRECLDHMLFWTTVDLEEKLADFQRYLLVAGFPTDMKVSGSRNWRGVRSYQRNSTIYHSSDGRHVEITAVATNSNPFECCAVPAICLASSYGGEPGTGAKADLARDLQLHLAGTLPWVPVEETADRKRFAGSSGDPLFAHLQRLSKVASGRLF